MRRVAIVCLVAAMFCGAAQAEPVRQYFTNKADVTFAWDYNLTGNPDLAGFRLYLGTQMIDVPGQVLTHTVPAFPTGSTVVKATAYDRFGNESDYSEEIQVNKSTIRPAKPTTIKITNPAFVIVIPPK